MPKFKYSLLTQPNNLFQEEYNKQNEQKYKSSDICIPFVIQEKYESKNKRITINIYVRLWNKGSEHEQENN